MSGSKRVDPYRNFKFRLSWKGRIVAGFNGLDGITVFADTRTNRKATRVRKLPGLRKYTNITLKRGITHDLKFINWARNVSGPNRDHRAELKITVMDERGKLSAVQKISRSWVSEFQALPDLDANANAVAIERMTLEHEGGERDEEGSEATKLCGLYRGVVVNNVDPLQMGRIEARVPAVSGARTLGWAMPCVPVNLPNTIGSALPKIGGNVWIQFEAGDVNRPVWARLLLWRKRSAARSAKCLKRRGSSSRVFHER